MAPNLIIFTVWLFLSITFSQNTTLPPTKPPTSPPTVTLTSTNYILVDKCRNWWSSLSYCEDTYNTTLASIHNQQQMEEATDLCVQGTATYDWCWIGLNDINEEQYSNGTEWEWTDGSEYNYSNWQPGRPDNSGNEDCVHTFTSGLWNDRGCNYCYRSLCMKPDTISPTTNPTNYPSTNPTNAPTINPIVIDNPTTESQSASESESGTTSTIIITVNKANGDINGTLVGGVVNNTLTGYLPNTDEKLENTVLTNTTAEYSLEIPNQRVVLDTDEVGTDIQQQLNEKSKNDTSNKDIYTVEVVVVYTYLDDVTPTELWIIILILVGAICCIIPTFIGLFVCYCMYNRRQRKTDGVNTTNTVEIATPESVHDAGPGLSKQDSLADTYVIKPGEAEKFDLVKRDYGNTEASNIEGVDKNVHSFVDNPNVIDTDKGKDVDWQRNNSEELYGNMTVGQTVGIHDVGDGGGYHENNSTKGKNTEMGF